MSDDMFAKLVAEEVKNRVSTEAREELFDKTNWDKWERALIALVQNLNSQLEKIEEDRQADTERYSAIDDGHKLLSEALAYYEKQSKKIERFRFHVENRLVQVSKMIATGSRFEDDVSKQIVMLKNAISKHREMMTQYDLEPTPIDNSLWDVLEGKWTFDNIKESDI